ncbi:hypothetical protein ACK32R_04975 [Aeromonas dhakensis]|uniref:hypothetical protein n=1 Tax=Aeromonas dhakensis TaxID=196024 RepID=UPI003987AF9D
MTSIKEIGPDLMTEIKERDADFILKAFIKIQDKSPISNHANAAKIILSAIYCILAPNLILSKSPALVCLSYPFNILSHAAWRLISLLAFSSEVFPVPRQIEQVPNEKLL